MYVQRRVTSIEPAASLAKLVCTHLKRLYRSLGATAIATNSIMQAHLQIGLQRCMRAWCIEIVKTLEAWNSRFGRMGDSYFANMSLSHTASMMIESTPVALSDLASVNACWKVLAPFAALMHQHPLQGDIVDPEEDALT